MKVFACILVLAVASANAGFLPLLGLGQSGGSGGQSVHYSVAGHGGYDQHHGGENTKIIKVIHEADHHHEAAPAHVIKVIHAGGDSHHSAGPVGYSSHGGASAHHATTYKVIVHQAPAPVQHHEQHIKVIHEHVAAPAVHHHEAPEHIKIVKIVQQEPIHHHHQPQGW